MSKLWTDFYLPSSTHTGLWKIPILTMWQCGKALLFLWLIRLCWFHFFTGKPKCLRFSRSFRYLTVVRNTHLSGKQFSFVCFFIFVFSVFQAFCQAISSSWHHNLNKHTTWVQTPECTPNLPYFDGKYNGEDIVSMQLF